MNPRLEDVFQDYLRHEGVSINDGAPGRGSGRYPYGSGKNPHQRFTDFLSRIDNLKEKGLSDTEIARAMGLSTTQYRAQKAVAKHEIRNAQVSRAKELRDNGYSYQQIADELGIPNESSVRSLLNTDSEARMNQAMKTAVFLKQQVAEKGMIDVGANIEAELGISKTKLAEALSILEDEGYPVYGGGMPQVTNPGKQTNLKVLCPPGTEHKDIYNYENIHYITDYTSHDGGDTFDKFVYPKSMDSSRLTIRYAEEGGVDMDGVIEIRRNVPDLSLGESHYAQVRILVDNNRYLKGMAVYADDLPDGIDVRFNTNKKQGTPTEDVLKKIKNDPENPFGSLIKAGGQSYYTDENGERQLSLINKRSDEGDWGEWSDHLPSQFLSKQPMDLIKKQLRLAEADKESEFEEICSLTNPTVKVSLLESFADNCDSAAVHLQAAALPRQKYQVIMPVPTMKDDEVYAPNYKNGEKVALVRYPHGGTFEIPILTVNNKQSEALRMLGSDAKDVVGINASVAGRLSGADFDGDTVMVIPTGGKTNIQSTRPLEGLEGFDPKLEYGGKPEGSFKRMKNTQNEMGRISNLITDMTLKGATESEIARAVRHSMVVIDAEKHGLDYKQSERDNGIKELKRKYQGRIEDGKYREGAATLISRAKSETSIPKRKGAPRVDKETGEVSYKFANTSYVDKSGKVVIRTEKSNQMSDTKDARTLSSGTPQEEAYADYANKMKSLANRARKEAVNSERLKYSPSARIVYQTEYDSLMAKLNLSEKNRPKERQAQAIANSIVNAKKTEYPDMTKKELKKVQQLAITSARSKVGAERKSIKFSDREWEAVQAGAVSNDQLRRILKYADMDELRQRATPRSTTQLSSAKVSKLLSMSSSGYTNSEIAEALGISATTVSKYLRNPETETKGG